MTNIDGLIAGLIAAEDSFNEAASKANADGIREAFAKLQADLAAANAAVDFYRKGLERSNTIEPRPWWSVFGLDRILASKMHQEAAKVGPLVMELALQHLVDEATKRGVHPSEIRCAHREARDELMPEPKPAGGPPA